MNKRTLTALQDSIRKWQEIANGTMPDLGAENCALCMEFLASRCRGCPVARHTGEQGCYGTPYHLWLRAANAHHETWWDPTNRVADTPELVRLAKAERDFLRSLLPATRA